MVEDAVTSFPASGSASSSLLARVKNHDQAGWQRLAEMFGPLVFGWGRQAGLQPSDAADVMQEVFGAVAASIGSFQRSQPGDSFRGWLWTITRNKIRDHFRRLAAQPGATGGAMLEDLPERPPKETTDGLGAHYSVATHQALEIVRAEFEDRTWQAFWQVAIDERSPADVAEALSLNVSAVYMAKSRVLKRLRQELAGLFGE